MSDDIVTRLKRELEEIRRSGYGHDWPLSQAIAVIEAQQAEVQRLRAELDECDQLRERMADVLRRTATALHGGALTNGLWSWHDLPELAQEARHG